MWAVESDGTHGPPPPPSILTWHAPTQPHDTTHSAGGIDGGLAFLVLLVRTAHPFYCRTLEFIFGWHRARINRWTNDILEWIFEKYIWCVRGGRAGGEF